MVLPEGWLVPADGWFVPEAVDPLPMGEKPVEPLALEEDAADASVPIDDEAVDPFVPDDALLELLVPDEADACEPLDPVVSAARVWPSSWPEACRPCACWNCLSADLVFGPILPSTAPTLKPLSLSACCAWLTWLLSPFEDTLDEADRFAEESADVGEFGEL